MRIGPLELDGNLFLAPMAGYTSWPMRLICRKTGAALVFTEMVSAGSLVQGRGRSRSRTQDLLESRPAERPLGVQIFGADPEIMAEAAAMVEDHGADLVDINMGCPVKKVVRTGAGAALLKDPKRARALVRRVRAAVKVPLTIKIRAGWDPDHVNSRWMARMAEDEGVDAVTVHGRLAGQTYGEPADWGFIARAVSAVSIPVIGNGDVKSAGDAARMISLTGCAAVMIGRAARGNPWIFRKDAKESRGSAEPSLKEMRDVVSVHYQNLVEHAGEHLATLQMRKHLAKYCKGLPGATEFRAGVNRAQSQEQMQYLIDRYFAESEQ